jgi:MFS superfamily sulfate permease-like transporter
MGVGAVIRVWIVFLIGFVMFACGVLVGVFWTLRIERAHRLDESLRSPPNKRADASISQIRDHQGR